MSRTTRTVLAAALASLAIGVAAAPAMAGKTGPNNANAKLCQKGGYLSLWTPTGDAFATEAACVSYAANGGQLATAKLTLVFSYFDGFYPNLFTYLSGKLDPSLGNVFAYGYRYLPANYILPDGLGFYGNEYSPSCADLSYRTAIYVTGTASNGTPITSNTVQTGCQFAVG